MESQEHKLPALTHKPQGKAKRLTQAERIIIHTERKSSGKTTRAIAKEYGVSNSTVTDIEHNERLKAKIEQSDHIKKALSANLYISAQDSLDCITPKRLLQVNAYQNAIITATLIDKARLIEGSSTLNVSIKTVVSDLEERKRQLLDAINVTPDG